MVATKGNDTYLYSQKPKDMDTHQHQTSPVPFAFQYNVKQDRNIKNTCMRNTNNKDHKDNNYKKNKTTQDSILAMLQQRLLLACFTTKPNICPSTMLLKLT